VTYQLQKRGVFFDLDGTLVNTLPDIAGNLNQVRSHFGLKLLNQQEIQGNIGKGIEHLIKSCFPELDASRLNEGLKVMMEFYVDKPHHGGLLYPHVEEVLNRFVASGLVIGIATNKPIRAALSTVKYYLPNIPFSLVYGPENVSAKKPDPRHLLEAISDCNLTPENCYYVGDDEVDFLTAQSANVTFFGLDKL